MITIGISGCGGRMGKELVRLTMADPGLTIGGAYEAEGHPIIGEDIGTASNMAAAGVTVSTSPTPGEIEVLIDFSLPAGTRKRIAECTEHHIPMVIGTTGLTDDDQAAIDALGRVAPVIQATNFSLGVNVLWALAAQAATMLGDAYEVEVIESHHRNKVDAPSGTAKTLVEKIAGALERNMQTDVIYGREGNTGKRPQKQIGVHALRQGLIVGEHTAIFAGDTEIIELKHRCLDRATFAEGALVAAKWIQKQTPGRYTMAQVLGIE